MLLPLRHLVCLGLATLALSPATAQAPAPPATVTPRPTLNHSIVFLDPAHGGEDTGARLVTPTGEQLLEKDITLAFAGRLRSQLASLGLTVLTTRETEVGSAPAAGAPAPAAVATPDQRAGLANHVRPFACLVLHATGAGAGVHLITSTVGGPPASDAASSTLSPWDAAQAPFLPQSERLAAELSNAVARLGLPVHTGHATIQPLENLTCPAVLVELAPIRGTLPADSSYQARVAQAIATTLLFWRGHAEPDTPSASESGSVQP